MDDTQLSWQSHEETLANKLRADLRPLEFIVDFRSRRVKGLHSGSLRRIDVPVIDGRDRDRIQLVRERRYRKRKARNLPRFQVRL